MQKEFDFDGEKRKKYLENFNKKYPGHETGVVGKSILGRDIDYYKIGVGKKHILAGTLGVTLLLVARDVIGIVKLHKVVVLNARKSLEFSLDNRLIGNSLCVLREDRKSVV